MDRPHPPFCRLQGSRERLCWPLLGPTGRPRWALMMPSASPAFSPFSVRVVGGFLARTRNRSKSDLHFGIYTVAHKYVETFVDFYQQRPITRIDAGLSIKVDTRTETWLTDFHETLHVYNVARNIRIFQVFFFFLFIGNYSHLGSENSSSIWHWENVLSEMETVMNEFRVWERRI